MMTILDAPLTGIRSREALQREETTSFSWSTRKLRKAAAVLTIATLPAAVGLTATGAFAQILFVAWLATAALLSRAIARRTAFAGPVLDVDAHGILDRRLMPKRIHWDEIASICPVNFDGAQVVDIRLRRAEITLSGSRFLTRLGVFCQAVQDVPAVTISILLLDGKVRDLLAAIARHRPDLVHAVNRNAARGARLPSHASRRR